MVARIELSRTSEESPPGGDPGAPPTAAPSEFGNDHSDEGAAPLPLRINELTGESAPDAARTGTESGDRSASSPRSVLAELDAPGPTAAGLRRLAAAVGNDFNVVDRFVCDYLSLLNHRMDGLARLLAGDDPQATRIWVLSLETTSSMLGAGEVVSAAAAVRALVEAGDDDATSEGFRALKSSVDRLQSSLAELGFSAPPSCRLPAE